MAKDELNQRINSLEQDLTAARKELHESVKEIDALKEEKTLKITCLTIKLDQLEKREQKISLENQLFRKLWDDANNKIAVIKKRYMFCKTEAIQLYKNVATRNERFDIIPPPQEVDQVFDLLKKECEEIIEMNQQL